MAHDALEAARQAFVQGDWSAARAEFEHARRDTTLDIGDLRALRQTMWWLGDGVTSMALAEEIYRRLLADGAMLDAGMEALQLAQEWGIRGDGQLAGAWLNRAHRSLDGLPPSSAHGYLVYLEAVFDLEVNASTDRAVGAVPLLTAMAHEQSDPALTCFARVLTGGMEILQGRTAEGFGELDEAMLSVLAGDVPPLWGGDIFCSVIHVCEFLGDFTRMRSWTDSLARWAGSLSDTFLYAGVTRIHQLQLQSAEGSWDLVEREVGGHSEALIGSHGWVAGAGYQELGEVRRLRGDSTGAARAFDRARELGVDPQPGSALLLAARDGPERALEELRASLAQRSPLDRARLIPAAVDLALSVGETDYADLLVAELAETADRHQAPGLLARWHQAAGGLALAAGQWDQALDHLELAAVTFREQRCRYAIAQVHELTASARRGSGDITTAAADEATALAIYRQLGATPDVDRLSRPPCHPGGLTDRELEVLACIASGASNRDVAAALCISEKTVGRHLANIFVKIGVGSRTAASAWARDNGVRPSARI